MEATGEGLEEFLQGVSIRPPRLEDAGLEDCALPPDSIREAFARAANAVKSRIIPTAGEDDSGCVNDSGPVNGDRNDVLLGENPKLPPCGGGEREGVNGGAEDKVVVIGHGKGSAKNDVLIGGDEEKGEEGRGCVVDGVEELHLPGLEKKNEEKVGEGDEEEEERGGEKEKPVLVEDLI